MIIRYTISLDTDLTVTCKFEPCGVVHGKIRIPGDNSHLAITYQHQIKGFPTLSIIFTSRVIGCWNNGFSRFLATATRAIPEVLNAINTADPIKIAAVQIILAIRTLLSFRFGFIGVQNAAASSVKDIKSLLVMKNT